MSPSECDFVQEKKIHPVLGLDLVEVWEVGSPWRLWHFFGSSSGSLHLAPLVCSPGGLQHPMPQQTWPDRSYGSSSSELLPVPSSALSVLKHLLHVQFSTALNSGKSKPILTGTLQDTSLQWGLSICLINSDLLPPAALALKLFFKNKWVATIFFFIDVEKKIILFVLKTGDGFMPTNQMRFQLQEQIEKFLTDQ